jgi:hypothetical protein
MSVAFLPVLVRLTMPGRPPKLDVCMGCFGFSFGFSFFATSARLTIGDELGSFTIQRIVGVLVQAADSSGVKSLFTDFKPGAEKGLCGKFLNCEADGVRGTSKASVANRPAAHAAIREEFGLSVVVKGGHGRALCWIRADL